MGFNKLALIGRLGRDPEFKTTPAGVALANFSLAVDGPKPKDGEDRVTTWFRCVAFRRLAEVMRDHCRKGMLVYVEGPVQLEEYNDKEGNHRANLGLVVNELQMLSSPPADATQGQTQPAAGGYSARPQQQQQQQAPPRQSAPTRQAPPAQTAGRMPWDDGGGQDDDLPF